MLEVEIMRDTWYGKANIGEVVVFADIEKESVQTAHILTMHKNVLDAMRNDSCTLNIHIESTANLSQWVQNLWGYELNQRKMVFFGCFAIHNLDDGWRLEYRIVSVLHIHAKSNLMKKVKLTGIRAIPKSALLSNIRNVNRHIAEGGRKTMQDLCSYDHEFVIDLMDVKIDKKDLIKISEAWANNYYIFRAISVCSNCSAQIVVYATRTQGKYDEEIDIKLDWKKIEPILERQELPESWVLDAVNKMRQMS